MFPTPFSIRRPAESAPLGHAFSIPLGLVWVYNHLPPKIVEQPSVSRFQAELQRLVKDRAKARCADWAQSLSPRAPLSSHPSLRYR